jgi:hypothetical protein
MSARPTSLLHNLAPPGDGPVSTTLVSDPIPSESQLDRLVRPDLRLFGRTRSTFQVCGLAGLTLALALALGLVHHQGYPVWVMGVIALAAVASFFVLAMATKVVTGKETLVYYHHEIAILVVATLVAWLCRRPVLPYLDATILGVGAFLVCGRIGCFMVGCCHGRPGRFGVRYRSQHAAAGFPSCYAGVRLLPVQMIEALGVLAIVAVGIATVLGGGPPGAALAWYIVAYDAGRFALEFLRGDAERPYRAGFSSPQWLSVVLTLGVVAAGAGGVLPWRPWHAVVALGLIGTMVAVAVSRRKDPYREHELFQPRHVREIAELVERFGRERWGEGGTRDSPTGAVHRTSCGLGLSAQRLVADGGSSIEHVAFSRRAEGLTTRAAQQVATLLLRFRQGGGTAELIAGREGVYHLLIHS